MAKCCESRSKIYVSIKYEFLGYTWNYQLFIKDFASRSKLSGLLFNLFTSKYSSPIYILGTHSGTPVVGKSCTVVAQQKI